jgi:hypothetical protein
LIKTKYHHWTINGVSVSIKRELMKGLSPPKIPKVFTLLNATIAECEYDIIIDVQCNGLVLHEVLLDKGKN